MTTPELPPLPNPPLEYRHEGCTYIDRESFLEWHDQHSARERILLARVERLELTVQELGLRNAELEADAGRYRVALIDCMGWMESGRASTDWGFWDWEDGDAFMRAKAAIDAIDAARQA